jgi:hypothetical protein
MSIAGYSLQVLYDGDELGRPVVVDARMRPELLGVVSSCGRGIV